MDSNTNGVPQQHVRSCLAGVPPPTSTSPQTIPQTRSLLPTWLYLLISPMITLERNMTQYPSSPTALSMQQSTVPTQPQNVRSCLEHPISTLFFLLAQSLMSPFTWLGFSGYHRLRGMSQASVVDLYDIEHGRTSVPHSSRLEKWAEDGTTISISIASEMSIHSFLGQVPGSLPSSIQSVHCEDH